LNIRSITGRVIELLIDVLPNALDTQVTVTAGGNT